MIDWSQFYGDAEPLDEDDPDLREELFESFRYLGLKPEDLIDPRYIEPYRVWLQTAPPDH